ncbi:hypothetical protein ACF0H5_007822 [Mactra antiquata]
MLSQLSKGYGSWTAGYVDPYFGEKRERECTLPEIDQDSHFHGVTIGTRSGRSTAMSYTPSKRSREPTADGIPLPKTYTTRKGALQLFVGPDDLDDDEDADNDDENDGEQYPLKPKYVQIKRPQGQELIDLSLKLGTMERLAMSVLQYGDEDYDHDHTSVTDSKNKAVLKFLHSIDDASSKKKGLLDTHVQPGGDLKNYLNDLKHSAGSRFSNMYVSKSRESLELQAILRGLDNSGWPLSYNQDGGASEKSGTPGQFTRPVSRVSSRGPSPGVKVLRRRYFNNLWPSSTPRSTYQVLSAKKVAASIRSNSYLGRPSSRISVADDEVSETDPGTTAPVAPTSVLLPSWTPTDSTDDFLIDTRDKFYLADEDGDSSEDGRKRRRFKERSFLTNNSQLYQGRNSRKGEGQRGTMEVKVSSKGDGDSIGQMSQIEEELGDNSESKKLINEVKDVDSCSDISENWAVKVSHVKQINVSEEEGDDDKNERLSPVVAKSPDHGKDRVKVKVDIRPSSAHSGMSSLSSNSAGTASTRAMSIITIQNAKNASRPAHPPNFDKYNLKKRRGTYQYDPDKGLIRSAKDRRPSEPFIRARSNSSHSVEQYKNQNSQKRFHGTDKTPPPQHFEDVNERLVEHTEDDVSQNMVPEVVIEQPSVVNEEPVNNDHDDYEIDDLDECNEEIQQIEAQAEHSDTDSDSCMDEEVIKVILEGQKSNEDLMDQHQYDDNVVDTNDENKDGDNDFDVGTMEEERKSTSSVANDGVIDTGGDGKKSVSEDLIGTEGTRSIHDDDMEGTEEQVDDMTVDEIFDENVSDVRSTKSGKKSQSRKSTAKSVLESEDGGAGKDEYGLPVLDSDRLENMDGMTNEENQTVNDEQTGFSGSTDSYSDILAANKLSEPDNISQSRGSSSPKLSRSSSAACSKTPQNNEINVEDEEIAAEDELIHDVPDSGETINSANIEQIDDGNVKQMEDTVVEDTGDDEIAKLQTNNEDDVVGDSLDKIKSPDEEQDKAEEIENESVPNSRKLEIHVDLGATENLNETNSEISGSQKPTSEPEVNASPIKVDVVQKVSETKTDPKSDVNSKPKVVEKKPEPPKPVANDKIEKKQSIPNATLKTDPKPEQNQKVTKPVKKATTMKPIARTDTKNNIKTKPVASTNDKNKSKVSNKDNSDKKDIKGVGETLGDSSRLEGEGLFSIDTEIVSRLDEDVGDGLYNTDVTEEKDAHSIAAELESLGLAKGKKGSKVYPLLPPGQRPKAPPEKQKIPDHLQDALNRRASQSKQYLEEDLERMTAMVGETLSGPTLEAVGEGLTEEELELAKQLLQQKLDDAKGQLEGKSTTSKAKSKKTTGGKSSKKSSKKKNDPSDDKSQEEIDREAIRARHDHEKQLREQEAAELQRKIAENKRLLKLQADQTSAKSKELLDEMERLEREALDMQRAEDEARQILADERKKQREEREARRKADLERKKQEAMDRRERERKEMEEKRQKELKMMEQIADAEMRRRMREEEERRIDEEERLAQERYEAEMREAQRQEEEEEERLKEMERQAEEEAMQRLIEEREAAERERRRIREEEEAFREAERLRMEQMAEEYKKLEDERQRLQDIEDAKREAERQNLLKLRQLEEEARLKMQEEIEKRRTEALTRRDFNLENKQHVDKLRHYQGITRAWTFSYFVHWPRETYESRLRPKLQKGRRSMGMGDPRKVKINNPPPKKVEEAPPGGGEAPAEATP